MNIDYSYRSFSQSASNSKQYLLLFILWPFMAFISSCVNFQQKEARKVAYMFLVYYGLTFVVGNAGNDAERYALFLRQNSALTFSDFLVSLKGLYSSDTSVDIVEPLISFIVSRFTNDHRLLFGIYAAVFGFFYLKSISLLYDRIREKEAWNGLIHLGFFAMILPIMAINGFRMWTAAWIFFYGAYHVILYRDARYILVTLAASLVHFSFLSANAVLLIYYFAGNRNVIYFPLAVISFILPKLITPLIQSIFGTLSGALRSRAEMYSSESVILGRQEATDQLAWFMQIGENLVLYYLLLAIVIIQIRQRYLAKEQYEKNLFSFLLLFLAFVNFGKEIPSFGGRFQVVFFMLATLYIFLYSIKTEKSKINLITLIGLFPMVLYAAISFRQGADSMNAWIFTPGLGIPFFVQGISVTDFLFR